MGHLISKISKKLKHETEKHDLTDEDFKKKLYKPIGEFSWKNASPAEIHKESLPHYAKRFQL